MNKSAHTRHLLNGVLVAIGIILMINRHTEADFVFSEPINVGPPVNTSYGDSGSCISADALAIYFTSNRPGGQGGWDLWFATRATRTAPWGEPVNLGTPVNTSDHDVVPAISPDGLSLYFTSDRPGGYGDFDLWVTTRVSISDPWGEPVNLGTMVNSNVWDARPSISADGLSLYFGSNREKTGTPYSGLEYIYVTQRPTINDPWSIPVRLGPTVNSGLAYDSAWPHISADGRILFFGSDRPGGMGSVDLWFARRIGEGEEWSPAVNLGTPINTSFNDRRISLSADGRVLFFPSNRPGGFGERDIWQAAIEPVVDFNGDNQVDAQDMSILVDHWHTGDPLCDIGPMPWGDGIVDEQDLRILSEYLEPGFGRIAHWKLDETEGDIAYDSVGSDHANVHGEAVWQPDAGVIDGALELDGVDDYIAPMLILNPQTTPFRVLAWIKGGAPGQVIASQTPDEFTPGSAYLAADPADGSLVTGLMLSNLPLDSDTVITNDEWHEVGLEWDGEHRHLLVNGEEVAVDEMALPALDCTGWLNIGTGKDMEPGSFWSGLIDDVRVYEKGEL